MANSYGTLTSVTNSNKITVTSQTQNGASSVNTGAIQVVTLTCQWADRATYVPNPFTPLSSGSPFLLTNADLEELPGGLCKITLTYTASAQSLPATTYTEQSSQVEEPIQTHPDFADWADEWDSTANGGNGAFLPSSDKRGITSFIKGSITVTVTTYSDSKPSFSGSTVGTLASPGSDYGSADNWLIIGSNRSLQGYFWVTTTQYLYSPQAYNSDIYST